MRTLALVAVAACSFSAELEPPRDTSEPAPRCFQARCRRTTLTIDHTKVVGGPHENFPVLVQLSDPQLANASSGGADVVVTAADGTTALPFEIEAIEKTDLVAWVAVPSLSSLTDTTLHVYYGDPIATDSQTPDKVWNPGYQAVWHLGETGKLTDSTANANTGSPQNDVLLGVAGKLGPAVRFSGDDDHILVTKSESLASTAARATLGMWILFANPAPGEYQRLLMSASTFANDTRGMEWANNPDGAHFYYPSDAGGNNFNAIAVPFKTVTWHHVVLTQDFATRSVKFFVDGTEQALATNNTPALWTNLTTPADWYWGGVPPRATFAGMMDEIRVSNVVRSPGWIATEFANQSDPAAFYR